jgi:hypothetical protein
MSSSAGFTTEPGRVRCYAAVSSKGVARHPRAAAAA